MASTSRMFLSCNRQLSRSLIREPARFEVPRRGVQQLHWPCRFSSLSVVSQDHSSSNFLQFPSFYSLPLFPASPLSISGDYFSSVLLGSEDSSFRWNFASERSVNSSSHDVVFNDGGAEVAVVMLGWLGAKPKHLRRYVELYNGKGIHAVTFVASVADVLSFDLGKKLEKRIKKLAHELVSWLSNEDGRNRFLIFHTFSNTGWLAYGAILDNLKDRQDLLKKIKGCIVDSGGDPNIDPKVWAAGFTTALLKKSSAATYPSTETGVASLEHGINGSKTAEMAPSMVESLLLFAFEKFFSYLLNLPTVNQLSNVNADIESLMLACSFSKIIPNFSFHRKLSKIIAVLSKDQPPCPQLYLYSTGDKVIPFQAVESFINDQKRGGKPVASFNFCSSPHVDHYRAFPDVYASRVHDFLEECFCTAQKC